MLPILVFALFMMIVGNSPKNLNIAVINSDVIATDYCANSLNRSENLCNLTSLSCKFLAHLKDGMTHISYENISQAIIDTKKGRNTAIFSFNKNFSSSFTSFFFNELDDSDENIMDESQIEITMDQTNYIITSYLKFKIADAYKKFVLDLNKECNVTNEKLGQSPLNFLTPIYGEFDFNFKFFMFPPLIIVILFHTSATLSAFIFLEDRISGCWNRILLSGVNIAEVILSHVIIQSFVLMIHHAQALFVILIYFEGLNAYQISVISLILIITQYSGLFIGLCIACLERTLMKSQFALSGLSVIMLYMSGIIWPIEGMTKMLQFLAKFSPFTHSATSMKNVIMGRVNISGFDVTVPVIWMIISIIAVTVILTKRKFNSY